MDSRAAAAGVDAAPSYPPTPAKTFEEQVLAQRQSLRALARYLCRNRVDAEDLLQEVLFRAFRYRAQFEDGTNIRAWLGRIMRNTHSLGNRAKRRQGDYDRGQAEARSATSVDPTINLELDDVRRAITLMPAQSRQILLLAAGGSSYDEISFILGCPVGTVKSRLSRARDLLQAVLSEGDFKVLACSRDPLADLEAQFWALSRPCGGARYNACAFQPRARTKPFPGQSHGRRPGAPPSPPRGR
jgi:RNA polymerase sigma-70 factor (ECF subfamily)